jgi:hypothetical protein
MSDDTGNMWVNMLGLGPLFKTINDPAFQQHIQTLVTSIQATAARCDRMERLLLAIAGELGIDAARILPAGDGRTAVPAQLGAVGTGRSPLAGSAADHGIGTAA